MRKILLLSLLALALLPGGAATAATLYVPNYNDDVMLGFTTASDGLLTPIGGSPFELLPSPPGGGTIAFAMTPDGNRAVAGFLFNGGMRGFSIDAAGAITPAQPKIGDLPELETNSAAVSPDGRFAYFTTRTDARGVRAYSIDAAGALTGELAGSPYGAGVEQGDVAITPNGRFLFTSVSNNISRFTVNADGTLTPLGNQPLAGARWLQTSPDGRFLFTTSGPGGSDLVTSYTIGPDGSLTQNGLSVPTGDVSLGVLGVTPDGGFLYAPDSNLDAILTIRVNPDGSLSTVGAPFAFADMENFAVSPDGRLLYGHRGSSGGVWVSPIAADGRPVAFTLVAANNPSTLSRIAFRAVPSPVAEFSVTAGKKPLSMRFDAAASTISRGAITSFEWDFDGDGTFDRSAAVADHSYRKAGVYSVTLRAVADRDGCPNHQVYFGQSTVCADPAPATKTVIVDTPPWIRSLKVSPRSVRGKAKIRYTLTEKARVTFVAERKTVGRVTDGKCRKATRKNRRAKKCTLWVRASKSFRHSGRSGSNSLKITRKIRGKRLKARSYRLNAVAVDSAKAKSPVKTAPFKIK